MGRGERGLEMRSGVAHGVSRAADGAGGDAANPLVPGVFDGASEVGNGVGEARGVRGEAQEIVEDEDLAVRLGAGADADEGERGLGHDFGGDFVGDGLDQEHGGAGLFHGDGIGDDAGGLIAGTAGGAIAASDCGTLREAAYVGADGDPRAGHGGDGLSEGGIDLEFDDVGVPLGQEAPGVADRFGDADLIGKERHVSHDDRARRAALDRGGQGEGDVKGHVDRAREAEDNFGGGIAHEEDVDAAAFEDACEGCVVAGEAGEGGALAGHAAERLDGDGLAQFGEGVGGCRDWRDLFGLGRGGLGGGGLALWRGGGCGGWSGAFGAAGFHGPSVPRGSEWGCTWGGRRKAFAATRTRR